jgi:CheY-like chemotaxis protein
MHRPLRILLAEDHLDDGEAAARSLQGENDRVDTAARRHVAVGLAARTRYDIILLSVELPIVDGLEAAVAVRADERVRGEEPVPIVAYSSHQAEGLKERCIAAGTNEFIVAQIGSHDLVEAVRKWADRRPTVLLADDSPHVRQLVIQQLRGMCRVVTATNGKDALEQFARHAVSLVLLDMNMPVLDGYATAVAIRQRPDGLLVPIVALTASDDDEARTRAVAAGCTMHVAKPVTAGVLQSIVEFALQHDGGSQATAEGIALAAIPAADVQVEVEPFMADLVPAYVTEKRRQVRHLKRLVHASDLSQLRRVAHDLKGTGTAYGIPEVTRLGSALESAGQQGDAAAAAALVDELDELLARVQQKLGA